LTETRSTPATAKRIGLWPLDRLVPYARNARTHSPEQVALIAAGKLGLAEVPVIVLDHLSELQRRAYVLADNRLALSAGWDEEMLGTELAAIESEGFELGLLGFTEGELADLMAEAETTQAGPEEEAVLPPPAIPVTQPGDLWRIGPHRVICGDCRDGSVIAKLFQGRKANVVVTSSPYATQRESPPTRGTTPQPRCPDRRSPPCGRRENQSARRRYPSSLPGE
jgi:hypothetical protein